MPVFTSVFGDLEHPVSAVVSGEVKSRDFIFSVALVMSLSFPVLRVSRVLLLKTTLNIVRNIICTVLLLLLELKGKKDS